MIDRIGVVVPAHDEESMLAACLDALAIAAKEVALPVFTVVVLDSCRDNSREQLRSRPMLRGIEIHHRNVGSARRVGFEAIHRFLPGEPQQTWLATTDADSRVPPDWLSAQLELARGGAEAMVGTVCLEGRSLGSAALRGGFASEYSSREGHPHVHGANLGMTAAAYLEGGGVPPIACREDVALVSRLRAERVVRTCRIPVETSARLTPRVSGGFGDYLRRLAPTPRGRPAPAQPF